MVKIINPYLKERFAKILKIKGIGFLTLAAIVAETNAFSLIKNQRQLTSYAGYDVIENPNNVTNKNGTFLGEYDKKNDATEIDYTQHPFTLNIKGISSKYGKYSHLIGGIVMLLIGLLMIFKPEWLMFNFK